MKPKKPTPGELAILQVLWQRGPCTVRDVHAALDRDRATGYTTVLKLMQIMTDKGLLARDEKQRAHIYHPRLPRAQTQKQLVTDLLDRVFAGSASQLVMQALSARRASAKELAQIRRLLEEHERSPR